MTDEPLTQLDMVAWTAGLGLAMAHCIRAVAIACGKDPAAIANAMTKLELQGDPEHLPGTNDMAASLLLTITGNHLRQTHPLKLPTAVN